MALGDDLMVGHVHARIAPRVAVDNNPRVVKRRLRTETSIASLERGRVTIPEPPRLRALQNNPEDVPVSEASVAASNSPRSGPIRAHPYIPVGDAIGSSSSEYVPSVTNRAASEIGLEESNL